MKKLIPLKKNKIKSLDMKRVSFIKKKIFSKQELNSTYINNIPSLYRDVINKKRIKENKNEIDKLTSANLNILKTLSTFAKEEMLNNSYDIQKNKKYFSNLKSLDSLTELKLRLNETKKSPKKPVKKKLYKKSTNSNSSELSLNSHKITNKHKLKQNFTLHKSKPNSKKKYKRNSVIHMKSNFMSNAFLNEVNEDKLMSLGKIQNKNLAINYEMKTKINYEEFINEMEIMKINHNLRKDINFIKLKNKISRIKHHFKGKIHEEINESSSPIKPNKDDSKHSFDLMVDKSSMNNLDKFRTLKRKNELYDSFDDEEYKEEILGFYIAPDSWFIIIFDSILLFISMIYSIFVPFLLSKNYFSKNDNNLINYILISTDLIYIIECILNIL